MFDDVESNKNIYVARTHYAEMLEDLIIPHIKFDARIRGRCFFMIAHHNAPAFGTFFAGVSPRRFLNWRLIT